MKTLLLWIFIVFLSGTVEAEEKMITTSDGVKLYTKIEGTGVPLLYVHGGPGSGSYWFEELFGDFMEQHFTVVYLDQRGVGRSESAENKDYSLDRMTLDFEEVRKNLGFDSWVTLGHSFGGILQMGYAERYPEVIKGMIMVNCTIDLQESGCQSWAPKAAELVGETYTCTGDRSSLRTKMNELGGKLRSKNLFWKMGSNDPETFSKLNEISSELSDFNHSLGRNIMEYPEYWQNYKPLTSKLEMPVLYFYGKKDFMVGPEHYKGINFPNSMLWPSEGGHIPFIEDTENLKKAILAYTAKYNLQ